MDAKVNLDQQFKRFHDHWHPRIVAILNDYDIKLVKVQGEFVWHQHQDTDELFLVIDGRLRIQLQDHDDVVLGPGELFVVPRGVRHCPAADQERLELTGMVDTSGLQPGRRPRDRAAAGQDGQATPGDPAPR
jgi:mannose-6-phosphate isomerase-like protein (cupin superfamily)